MYDPTVLFDKLAGFDTADGIASFFKEQGIKGYEQDEGSCAIAMYFRMNVQDMYDVSVSDVIQCQMQWGSSDDPVLFLSTPAMLDFIGKFDQGMYPELIMCHEDEGCVCSQCQESNDYR